MPFWSNKGRGMSDRSISRSPEEILGLAKRYIVQETIGPLKRVAKVLGIGLAGATVFAVGGVIVLVGVLRVLQTETDNIFGGNWSFAPYLLTGVVGVAVVGVTGAIYLRSLRSLSEEQ